MPSRWSSSMTLAIRSKGPATEAHAAEVLASAASDVKATQEPDSDSSSSSSSTNTHENNEVADVDSRIISHNLRSFPPDLVIKLVHRLDQEASTEFWMNCAADANYSKFHGKKAVHSLEERIKAFETKAFVKSMPSGDHFDLKFRAAKVPKKNLNSRVSLTFVSTQDQDSPSSLIYYSHSTKQIERITQAIDKFATELDLIITARDGGWFIQVTSAKSKEESDNSLHCLYHMIQNSQCKEFQKFLWSLGLQTFPFQYSLLEDDENGALELFFQPLTKPFDPADPANYSVGLDRVTPTPAGMKPYLVWLAETLSITRSVDGGALSDGTSPSLTAAKGDFDSTASLSSDISAPMLHKNDSTSHATASSPVIVKRALVNANGKRVNAESDAHSDIPINNLRSDTGLNKMSEPKIVRKGKADSRGAATMLAETGLDDDGDGEAEDLITQNVKQASNNFEPEAKRARRR